MEGLAREAANKRRRLDGGEREDSFVASAAAAAAAAAARLPGLGTAPTDTSAFAGVGSAAVTNALLENELLRRRNEKALVDRLLQQQQQQQQQQTPSFSATSALFNRAELLRSLTSNAAPSNNTPTNPFSALGLAGLSSSAGLPGGGANRTARGLPDFSALLGSSAASRGLGSLPSSIGAASLPPSFGNAGTTSLPPSLGGMGGASASSVLGQSFEQRLRQVQQQQHEQQQAAQVTEMRPNGVSADMEERLRRLQQLSNLGTGASLPTNSSAGPSSLRPSLGINALPSRFNNSNISTISDIMKNRGPSNGAKKKALTTALVTKKLNTEQQKQAQTSAAVTATAATQESSDTNTDKNPRKRKVALLYMSCDDEDLSQYQTCVRKQIEVFEADKEDTSTSARGRNRPIVSGQVGIRCKHCKVVPPQHRQRAAIYYPSKLDRLYQMSQTIASVHLAEYCQHIPQEVRSELARLREAKSAALGGKKYWADAGRAMGLVENDKRLFYGNSEEAEAESA